MILGGELVAMIDSGNDANSDTCGSASGGVVAMKRENRELKHLAFLLSRRPIETKTVSRCRLPEHVIRSWRSSRRPTSSFLPPCWSVRTAKFFLSKEWLQAPNKSSINLCKQIIYLQFL